jgi:hypothetical protein
MQPGPGTAAQHTAHTGFQLRGLGQKSKAAGQTRPLSEGRTALTQVQLGIHEVVRVGARAPVQEPPQSLQAYWALSARDMRTAQLFRRLPQSHSLRSPFPGGARLQTEVDKQLECTC